MRKFKILMITAMIALMQVGCSSDTQTTTNTQTQNDTQQTATQKDDEQQYSQLSQDDPIEVTLWHYYAGSAASKLTEIVDEFNNSIGEEYGVTIVNVAKTSISELEIELTESAQGVVYADAMPSMFLAYADKVLELQELGVISDMNDFFTEEDKAFLINDFMVSGNINGEQTVLPVVKSTELLYMNKTSWDKFAGEFGFVDEDLATWEGLMDVSRVYYEYTDGLTPNTPNDGKAFFGMDSLNNFIAVSNMQHGVDIYDAENAQANIDLDVMKKVFDYYMEAVAMGYCDSIGKYRTDDIRAGDILCFIGSSAGYVYMPEWIEVDGQAQEIEWESLQYPYFEDENLVVVSQGAGIAVSKISQQQQQACALFLNFFWEDNIDFALDSAYTPVTTGFIESTDEEKSKIYSERNFEENVIKTYELIIEQIEGGHLYQSMPFEGSYTIRTELGNIFEQTSLNIRDMVNGKISSGVSRKEVMSTINLDEQLNNMIESFFITIENKGVK